jgi:Leucine-rich repeat (LRR) protein
VVVSGAAAELGQLTGLQTLNLSYNQLAALPPEISQLWPANISCGTTNCRHYRRNRPVG